MDSVNEYFEKTITREDIISTFSGVRPLYGKDSASPADISRGYTFDLNQENDLAPLLTVYGGKLTTHRVLAEHALKNLKKRGAFKERDPKLIEFDQFNPDVKELKNILDGQKIDSAIDDGFHSNICIINTFIALKELMASNYTYFIEDNHLVYEELKDIITNENIHSHGRLTVIEK